MTDRCDRSIRGHVWIGSATMCQCGERNIGSMREKALAANVTASVEMGPPNDVELAALTALVARETAEFEASARQYGEMQFGPVTPASAALDAELRRRKVIHD